MSPTRRQRGEGSVNEDTLRYTTKGRAMGQFTTRVRKIAAPDDEALRALLEHEAVSRGLAPIGLRYQTRSAYRLDSGTHIDYAFDVDVWTSA